jgi:hypothetical protein
MYPVMIVVSLSFSFFTSLQLCETLRFTSQPKRRLLSTCVLIDASSPWLRIAPAFTNWFAAPKPVDGATPRDRIASLVFVW